VFAASSLGGATREQYATMEAGGGAVAVPPKSVTKTPCATAVAARARARAASAGHARGPLMNYKPAAKLGKTGKINTGGSYHTRELAPRVRWLKSAAAAAAAAARQQLPRTGPGETR
jgi:hypothetical protein